MKADDVYVTPNPTSPTRPVIIDEKICTGCNACVDVCPADVFIPNPRKGGPPILVYIDECWYCSPCVDVCPEEGAIRLNYPLMWRTPWMRKETGKRYWVGMKEPPPSNTKPLA